MALHRPPINININKEDEEEEQDNHCEIPHRINAMYERLLELETGIGCQRFIEIPCTEADRETIQLVHSEEHYSFIASTEKMTERELQSITIPHDLYFCENTFLAAKLAAGGVVECVNHVTDLNRKSRRAIALVRPPGHHATRDEAMGK
jgi:histone deacetylase 6